MARLDCTLLPLTGIRVGSQQSLRELAAASLRHPRLACNASLCYIVPGWLLSSCAKSCCIHPQISRGHFSRAQVQEKCPEANLVSAHLDEDGRHAAWPGSGSGPGAGAQRS